MTDVISGVVLGMAVSCTNRVALFLSDGMETTIGWTVVYHENDSRRNRVK